MSTAPGSSLASTTLVRSLETLHPVLLGLQAIAAHRDPPVCTAGQLSLTRFPRQEASATPSMGMAPQSGSSVLTDGIKERRWPWSSPGGNSAVAKIHMP